MVSRLERWAEDARANGFVDEAMALENQAKVFRKAGVPDDFPLEVASGEVVGEDRTIEKLEDIIEIRSRLVKAMVSTILPKETPFERSRGAVAEELSKVINQQVGQYMADDIEIRDLVLPQYGESLRNTGFDEVRGVDKIVRDFYNRRMLQLARGKYSIGGIRNASLLEIESNPGISEVTASFAKAAFARPQPPEGQA